MGKRRISSTSSPPFFSFLTQRSMMPKVAKKKPSATRTSSPGTRSARPFGAHQSISGGLPKAVERATETGCDCMQIFTRNVNQWAVKPIDQEIATAFREAVSKANLDSDLADIRAWDAAHPGRIRALQWWSGTDHDSDGKNATDTGCPAPHVTYLQWLKAAQIVPPSCLPP